MSNLREKLIDKYERNKKLIFLCFFSTFVWGFIAHGFMFSNLAYSHDSLNEFDAAIFGHDIRIQFGRFLVPAYRILTRGVVAIPWIIGILALIYTSIAVFLVIKTFNVKSNLIVVLTSGIMIANMAVIATTATYIHDLDCDMFALMLAALAVYLWHKYTLGFLMGVIPLVLSLGLYQSYISVAITLITFYCILALLNKASYKKVLGKGIKGVLMLLFSGVGYAVTLKIVLKITGVQLEQNGGMSLYNIVDNNSSDAISRFMTSYFKTPKVLLNQPSYLSSDLLSALVIILGIITVILILASFKGMKWQSIVLTLCLIATLPIGMNFAGFMARGNSHNLMHYAIWLVYFFALLVVWQYSNNKTNVKISKRDFAKVSATVLVLVMLISNIYTSNATYLRKKMEYDATFSYMTRVTYDIEKTEGYKIGETEVVIIGYPSQGLSPQENLNNYHNGIVGVENSFSIWHSNSTRCQAYYDYVLMNPAKMADKQTFIRMNTDSEVAAMPCYPAEGSIKFVDGYLVAKIGNQYDMTTDNFF